LRLRDLGEDLVVLPGEVRRSPGAGGDLSGFDQVRRDVEVAGSARQRDLDVGDCLDRVVGAGRKVHRVRLPGEHVRSAADLGEHVLADPEGGPTAQDHGKDLPLPRGCGVALSRRQPQQREVEHRARVHR